MKNQNGTESVVYELTIEQCTLVGMRDSDDVALADTLTKGGVQKQKFINESGLYALIFASTFCIKLCKYSPVKKYLY